MDLGIAGKVALVGGGSGGLGGAIAETLALEGVRVAIASRRREAVEAIAADIAGAIGVTLDFEDARTIDKAVDEVNDRLGAVDIVIVNGGGPRPGGAVELDSQLSRQSAELLLHGPIQLVQKCIGDMRAKGWGRIVAVGSSSVQQPIPGLTSSTIYRSGLAAYLRHLADEVAAEGITVNMVLPGRIATARVASLDDQAARSQGRPVADVAAASANSIPARRYGRPEEFAAFVAFLCSSPASYITGEQVRVDGGLVRRL